MKKKWVIVSITILAVLFISGIFLWKLRPQTTLIVTNPQNKDSLIITENEWIPHTSINVTDTSHAIEVTYDQKYGRTVRIYCMAVFENKKENRYKCIAPWLGKKEIERSNINDFQTKIVLKSEIPTNTFLIEKPQ
jgi:hypothetical protein